MGCTETIIEAGRVVYRDCHTQQPVVAATNGGPGTELKAILKSWFGIEATLGCECNAMSRRMDTLGPNWCEAPAGMAEILAAMKGEHARRCAKGETRLPWIEAGARQLVLLACRRARAAAEG
jgi:hypothetical protein